MHNPYGEIFRVPGTKGFAAAAFLAAFRRLDGLRNLSYPRIK